MKNATYSLTHMVISVSETRYPCKRDVQGEGICVIVGMFKGSLVFALVAPNLL